MLVRIFCLGYFCIGISEFEGLMSCAQERTIAMVEDKRSKLALITRNSQTMSMVRLRNSLWIIHQSFHYNVGLHPPRTLLDSFPVSSALLSAFMTIFMVMLILSLFLIESYNSSGSHVPARQLGQAFFSLFYSLNVTKMDFRFLPIQDFGGDAR